MNIDNIDRVRELVTDEMIDAQLEAMPFQLLNGPELEGFRYDAKTWQEDCGDCLIGDEESSDYIRKQLILAFEYLDDYTPLTERSKMQRAQCINMVMANIGQQVIENVLSAGITRNKLGDM